MFVMMRGMRGRDMSGHDSHDDPSEDTGRTELHPDESRRAGR
jgi:hypothetical protein